MKTFLSLLLCGVALAAPVKRNNFEWKAIETIAVQDRGRIKPMNAFALDSVRFVTGKSSWKGMSPTEVVFGWLINYDKEWEDERFIRVDYKPLKAEIKLDAGEAYFTPKEVRDNGDLQRIVRDAVAKDRRKERQTTLEKKAIQLQNQLGVVDAVTSGAAWTIVPNAGGVEKDWYSLADLTQRQDVEVQGDLRAFSQQLRAVIDAFASNNAAQWGEASVALANGLRNDLGKGGYPSASSLNLELHYDKLRPFRWAWVLYTIAFVGFLFVINSKKKVWSSIAWTALLSGFAIHVYGFVVRMIISGRPPVTNMYESVIWVSFGTVLFAFIIWFSHRNAMIPAAAAAFALVCLVLADNLPLVLDPGIHPLEPVLRSNFWLTIHVLTITLSYAAFALSACLGNAALGYYFFKPSATQTLQNINLFMYRAMQIGVVLLAAGTILGGVWADYSWGRFWGWDPKEVWALIALLLYLAVLHGRFTAWLKGFGFVACTVMAFLGVVMAWYGVNFVLGVGLHSYGFGAGGASYVAMYVAAQVAVIGVAYIRYRSKGKTGANVGLFPR